MIYAIGNVKGGVGKTTLAANLTIALSRMKRDVLLIDGNEQGTAMAFTDLRTHDEKGEPIPGRPGYTVVALHGAAIRTQVRQLTPKYEPLTKIENNHNRQRYSHLQPNPSIAAARLFHPAR